jgi:Mg-chelatase subunit ChlD
VHAVASGVVVFSTRTNRNPRQNRGGLVIIKHRSPAGRTFRVPAFSATRQHPGSQGTVSIAYPAFESTELVSYYLHLDPRQIMVSQGDQVSVGQPIARLYGSNQGFTYPPHLHFELWRGCTSNDPNGYDFAGPQQFNATLQNQLIDPEARIELSAAASVEVRTVLVFDRSNSMNEGIGGVTKIDIARSAAGELIELLQQENTTAQTHQEAGLISFNESASLDVPVTSDIDRVITTLRGLRAAGNTNIGDALSLALQALPGNDSSRQIVVLLSDGVRTTGPTNEAILAGPVAEAAARSIRIYTIGFNQAQHLDEAFLREVAARTSGEYFVADDLFPLENVFLQVYHRGTGHLLAAFTGSVNAGQTAVAGNFQVPQGTSRVRLSLNWPGSLIDMIVTDPQGTRVAATYPGAAFSGDRPRHLLISNPRPGQWTVHVAGVDVPAGPEAYHLFVSASDPGSALPPSAPWAGIIVLAVLALTFGIVSLASRVRPAPVTVTRTPRTCLAVVVSGESAATVALSPIEWSALPSPVAPGSYARAVNGGIAVSLGGVGERRRLTIGLDEVCQMDGWHLIPWTAPTPPTWLEHRRTGKVYPVPYPKGTIGRAPGNAIRLEGVGLSRRHALFEWRDGRVILTDLGSAYGTFVEATRVRRAALRPGHRITFGREDAFLRSTDSQSR